MSLSMEIRILVDNQEYPKILVKNMEMMFKKLNS